MQQFKIMYKILKYLSNNMNYDELDINPITATGLSISDNMWASILKMLVDNGYIEGLKLTVYVHQVKPMITNFECTRITLKGLEYLEENSIMRKMAEIAKGIVEII